MLIEKIYRCRIDYKWDDDHVDGGEAVEKTAFKYSHKEPKVEIETFSGCSACFPYVKLESSDLKALKRLAGKIERYINKRKDVILDI